MDVTLAHAGRITWDEMLIIGALALPFLIAVFYLVSKVMRSGR
jgi:hypothetical protein